MLSYKINFYLRACRGTNGDKSPIYYRAWLLQDKMEASTGQQINPKYWDNDKQKVVKTPEAALINSLLDGIKSDLLQAITNLQLSKADLTIDNLKKLLVGEPLKETYYLIKVVTEHNLMFEQQVGIKYSYGSYKNYKTTLSFLKEFVRAQFSKADLPLKEINHRFCELYFVWLTTKKTSKQNGAAKHLQRLKKILNYAIRMEYISFNSIGSYSVALRPVVRVALTKEEIQTIIALPIQTEVLRRIRDIFIFQVYTGLAYSDVKAFCPKHIVVGVDGKFWLRMERTKTHNTFTVPLLPVALEILKMFLTAPKLPDDPIFPVLSNQKMNQHLKVLQELAGLSKNLHTHLPRHTFASTITLLNGVPIETVSKMLGHSKITMTQTYAKVGELKIAGDMLLLQERLTK